MNTIQKKHTHRPRKSPEFESFVADLLQSGLRVFVSNSVDFEYCTFFDRQERAGYAQFNEREGWKFSTVHRGNRNCGTGFVYHDDREQPRPECLFDLAFSCCSCIAPGWATKRDRESVVKFNGVDDWLKSPMTSSVYHPEEPRQTFFCGSCGEFCNFPPGNLVLCEPCGDAGFDSDEE